MIKTLVAFVLLAASLPLFAQDTNPVRSWTSSDGRVIQAKFLKLDGEAVIVEKDGKQITIPFTKLAPASVEIAKKLKETVTGAGATTTQVANESDASAITAKLRRIIVPKIDFENTPVREAINFLNQRSIELDALETAPASKGVKIVFSNSTAPDKIDALRVSKLHVTNIPLTNALKYVCDVMKLHSIIESSQVTLIPLAEYETEIHRRTFTVPPIFLARLAATSGRGADKHPLNPVNQFLTECGISFKEGAKAILSGNQLEVSNTRKELDRIGQLVNQLAAEAALDPSVHFRWLQTDPQTADAIVDVIKANKLSADAFDAKIDPQIKGGKITEVAAFEKEIISGERFVLEAANGKPPLVMEVEAVVGNGLMELRCVPEWAPKTSKGSALLRCNTATRLSRNHWYLIARWGDAKTDTLLLACGGPNPAKPVVPQNTQEMFDMPLMVHLDAEWRETNAADLAKAVEAPHEGRAKALDWLRGRSKLLASATGTCKSKQRSSHEHFWGGKSDAELDEELKKHPDRDPKDPPRPGVTFEWETTVLASDKPKPTLSLSAPTEENMAKASGYILSQELDLRLNATYMPPGSRNESQGMEFVFQGNKLQAGVPEFVTTKAAPPVGRAVVVLVITPWFDLIR